MLQLNSSGFHILKSEIQQFRWSSANKVWWTCERNNHYVFLTTQNKKQEDRNIFKHITVFVVTFTLDWLQKGNVLFILIDYKLFKT